MNNIHSHSIQVRRMAIYCLTGLSLIIASFFLHGLGWKGSAQLHTLMEVSATLLAFMVGAMALIRFYSKKNNTFLIIGAGFIGTAFLDGYHALVSSVWFVERFPSGLDTLIPWSWIASRLFLSVLLWFSYLAWKREQHLGTKGILKESSVFYAVAASTLACFLFFIFTPLPVAYYPDLFFHRPEEFIPALFFTLALIGYLGKGAWKHDIFEHWLVLALIVSIISQTVFMPLSGELFDAEFDAAHLLKKLSYIAVLTGLFISITSFLKLEYRLRNDLVDSKKALQDSDAYRAAIVEHISDGLVICDRDNMILSFNKTASDIFQYPAEEAMGQEVKTLISDDERERYESFFAACLKTGKAGKIAARTLETTGLRRDDTMFPLEVSTNEICINHQHIYLTLLRDISERKHKELEQQKAKEAAEKANKVKSEFLANMSHEIRTPMNAIIGLSQVALESELSEKQHIYIEQINSSSQLLLSIINDILDFSKIESGQLKIEKTKFFLAEILENISHLLSIKAEEKGLELLFNPDLDIPTCLIGDPLRLEQILVNLLNNAIKFTEEGQIILEINILAHELEKIWLEFAVIDSGIGIPEDILPRLFDAFVQADTSTTRNFGGSGLGLSICTQLTKLMDGEINVQSIQGQGSRFSVKLPFSYAGCGSCAMHRVKNRLPKVLIVDDNIVSQKILKSSMSQIAKEVILADCGEMAIRLVQQALDDNAPFDLILMDWNMPGIDGVQTADRIKHLSSIETPIIIMVTAFSHNEVLQHESKAALDAILTKPVSPSTLFDAVAEAMHFEDRPVSTKIRRLNQLQENAGNLKGAKILLVEDNKVNQKVMLIMLEALELNFHIANNGEQALAMLNAETYDAVLMDVQMPIMNGYQTAQAIRRQAKWKDLPIIAMTAHALSGDKDKCLAAGMNDYISKPVDRTHLINLLVKYIKPESRQQPDMEHLKQSPDTTDMKIKTTPELINTEEGIERLGGNQNAYMEILADFREDNLTLFEEVSKAISCNEWDVAKTLVHTVKGAAGNLALMRLHQISSELDAALKNAHQEEIQTYLPLFGDVLKETFDSIEALSIAPDPALVVETKNLEMDEVKHLLADFKNQLHQQNADALETFQSLQANFRDSEYGPVFDEIKHCLNRFDFDEALRKLEEIDFPS